MKHAAILLMVLTLTACETIAGFGRDVTRSAETVDRVLR